VQCQPQLLHVVLAGTPTSRFTSLLDSWQKQGNQNGDDGDHHQEFNQCESTTTQHDGPPGEMGEKVRTDVHFDSIGENRTVNVKLSSLFGEIPRTQRSLFVVIERICGRTEIAKSRAKSTATRFPEPVRCR
jgi:hypothetical protein